MKSKLLDIKKSQEINVSEDTQFVLIPDSYGGGKTTAPESVNLNFIFDKSGITAEILFMYVVPAGGKLDVTTVTHHKVPHTSCLTKVRGVLNDNSASNYVGKILIDKSAQQTSSFLEDNVLVVGEDTKNNSQPILQIEADDVKASHGATTGRIDSNQLYYLSSRGIPVKEAEKLITEGFVSALLDSIYDPNVKELAVKKLGLQD